MTKATLQQLYQNLPDHIRHLVQLSAVRYQEMNRTSLVELSAQAGNQVAGREIRYSDVKRDIADLIDKELFVIEKQGKIAVNRLLRNAPLHDSIRAGKFSQWVAAITADQSLVGSRHYRTLVRSGIAARGVIAFYSGDLEEFSNLCGSNEFLNEVSSDLCLPFERDIFASLTPRIQEWLLLNVIHNAIALAKCPDPILLEVVAPFARSHDQLSLRFCSAWIALLVAQGNLEGLKQVSQRFGDQCPEAEACHAFLLGDYPKSLSLFDQAMVRLKQKSKENTILDNLPGVLHVLLLIRENTPAATKTARGMINFAKINWTDRFSPLLEALESVFKFRERRFDTETVFQRRGSRIPILLIVESLMRVWCALNSKQLIPQSDFNAIAKDFKRLDLQWFVATVKTWARDNDRCPLDAEPPNGIRPTTSSR